MSGSHEKLPTIFWVQIVLVLIVGTIYLLTPAAPKHHGEGEAAEHEVDAETKTALKAVGEVAVKQEAGASGASRSGADIVKTKCAACHIAGVANAPKLDASAKEAWEKRMTAENGIDGLVASAQKGKGGMPPNGADPSLTADELKVAIINMLEQAGVEVAAADKAPAKPAESKPADATAAKAEPVAAAPAPKAEVVADKAAATTAPVAAATAAAVTTAAPAAAEKPATQAAATEAVKAPVEPEVPAAPKAEVAELTPPAKAEIVKAPTAPTAPKAEVMPATPTVEAAPKIEESKPAVEPAPTTSAPAAVPAPATAKEAAPALTEAPAAKVEESKPAAEPTPTTLAPAAVPAPAAKEAAPAPTEAPAAKPAPAAAVPAPAAAKEAAPAAPAAAVDLVAGEKTYKAICFSCHDLAVANAPKPGDKAAWAPRIAKGIEALHISAIKGDPKMPAMPPKGGNPNLSDAEVRNAVSYMVELSK